MNLRTTQMNRVVKRKRPQVKRKTSGGFSFISFMKVGVPILIIFLLAAALNVFNSETEQLNHKSVQMQAEMNKLDRDIANYRIKTEKLKGKFIYRQVAYFKLKLRSPVPGQVRKLRIRAKVAPKSISKSQTLIISQR